MTNTGTNSKEVVRNHHKINKEIGQMVHLIIIVGKNRVMVIVMVMDMVIVMDREKGCSKEVQEEEMFITKRKKLG
jgi:hypothetical protein